VFPREPIQRLDHQPPMTNPDSTEPEQPNARRALDFVLVSGLPRSGTSLMMQMLAAGGWPIMADNERPADADNPEGYFEWEGIKQLRQRPDIIREADGKVVKVISMHLALLPNRHRYRVLFMQRPIEQVVDSQFRMIARRKGRSEDASQIPDEERQAMIKRLRSHAEWTVEHLRVAPNFQLLEVDYPALVARPGDWVAKIADFAGRPNLPEATRNKMKAVVKLELFHNRRT
jgi:hypothetical protein